MKYLSHHVLRVYILLSSKRKRFFIKKRKNKEVLCTYPTFTGLGQKFIEKIYINRAMYVTSFFIKRLIIKNYHNIIIALEYYRNV